MLDFSPNRLAYNFLNCKLQKHWVTSKTKQLKELLRKQQRNKQRNLLTYIKTNLNRNELIAFQKTTSVEFCCQSFVVTFGFSVSLGKAKLKYDHKLNKCSANRNAHALVFPDFIGCFPRVTPVSRTRAVSRERRLKFVSDCSCVQCTHTSLAHKWLWRSQQRAEAKSSVNTCSFEVLTAVYWMISLGWGMQAAERRRLPAERYSLSLLSALQEEEAAASAWPHHIYPGSTERFGLVWFDKFGGFSCISVSKEVPNNRTVSYLLCPPFRWCSKCSKGSRGRSFKHCSQLNVSRQKAVLFSVEELLIHHFRKFYICY